MYHSIDAGNGDRLAVSPDAFASQMTFLASNDFRVISLEAAARGLRNGSSLDRTIVLTFDDGYRDFLSAAVPILERHRFPATLFVVTKASEGEWRRNSNAKPLLSRDEIKEIKARGFSLGSHTLTHPDLTSVDDETLARELDGSRAAIAGFGGIFIAFAYPGGTFTQRERNAVERAGYDCAVIVGGRWGNGAETDPFLLKREPMLASDSLDWFKKRVNGFYEAHYLIARARGIETR